VCVCSGLIVIFECVLSSDEEESIGIGRGWYLLFCLFDTLSKVCAQALLSLFVPILHPHPSYLLVVYRVI